MKFRSDRTRIAVVGCAYRMPGVGEAGLWEALIAGKDLVSCVESGRWAQEAYLHPRKSEPGTSYTFAAGSIGDVSGFDAAFFGISPREAEQMDPQQRLLLEMCWETFEHAGIRPSSLRGTRCGVYVGLSSVDYAYRRADDLGSIDATTMTGSTGSIAANRLSYVFDLRGPSMTIDTACSSSLVALHQACQSIRHGESEATLVGGISLHLHPYAFVGFSKASMLSRHGRCSVFDERGDGYVRSEGGAVVLLKPLAQAIADGNRVLGVIIETGVNNDGRKSGLTVPSHEVQATLLRDVYERAGIAATDIDYLEAHGTGTAVGDPIEARAIGEALGQHRPSHQPLPVGSVKSHVGHLEAASGMAGLVKAVYVLRHRLVPPNIHLGSPNPNIDFEGLNLKPVTEPLTLDPSRRAVVGVSSFGFGGTNAHAVLASFDTAPSRSHARPAPSDAPLLLSARSPEALRETGRRMAQVLRERGDLADYDIAYSARFARDIHSYRLAVSHGDRAARARALEQFADGGVVGEIETGRFRRDASPPAFVFSGNGSQWAGMGLQLMEEDPVFRETVAEIDELFASHSNRSLVADLREASRSNSLDRTEVAQPALFAVQAGLTRSLERAGIRPMAVCGHSVGEVAAAWASGALTLAAAVRVIYARSAHQAPAHGNGCMAAISLDESATVALLAELALCEEIVIAAINTATSVTVAGGASAMTRLGAALAQRRIGFRRLRLEYAFHSPAMDCIRAGLTQSLDDLNSQASSVPLYSTVTGAVLEGGALGCEYWWRNVREPVRFEMAIRAMLNAGINSFVEIGPRPVLVSYISEIAKSAGVSPFVLPASTATESGSERVRRVIQQLELSGALHDPARLFPVTGQLVELPHYPWQRERYWHQSTHESMGLLERRYVHPLLGYALSDDRLHWESHLDTARLPAYADHAVSGAVVFPAAGFVEMALAAGAARRPGSYAAIEDLEILSPLILEPEHSKVVRLRVDAGDGSFTIVSRDRTRDDSWRTHVVGRLIDHCVSHDAGPLQLPTRPPDIDAAAHYELCQSLGLQYGPAFQSVSSAWLCGDTLIGALAAPDPASGQTATLLHPPALDGAFQLLLDLAWRRRNALWPQGDDLRTFLPVRIDRLDLIQPHAHIAAAQVREAHSRRASGRGLCADFALFDASGMPVALAHGVRFRAAPLPRSARLESPQWIATRAVPMPRRDDDRAVALPAPSEAARLCAQCLHTPARSAARLRFAEEVEPLLDALCAAFAERALRELLGETIATPEQLVANGQLSASGVPLLRNLLDMLAEEGLVQSDAGQWSWSPATVGNPLPQPGAIWGSLIGDYPQFSASIARVGAAGVRLADRLRAGIQGEPRERRLGESTFSWFSSCTEEEAAAIFRAVREVLIGAAAAQPAHARLRVLHLIGDMPHEELGSSAWPVLDPDRCDVMLAAGTAEALDELRVRHASVAALPGHVIDVDGPELKSAETLGGRFDLIVLATGLADAADPAVRLRNTRGLLCDEGLLIVIEQHASRAEDLVFGMDPRWWQLTDGPDAQPLVSPRRRAPEAWSPLLSQAGFTDAEAICDAPASASGPYLLIARADAPAKADALPRLRDDTARTWLLVRDESGYSAELAEGVATQLSQHGHCVITVRSGADYTSNDRGDFTLDPQSAEHWDWLIAELQRAGLKPDGWVHLAGLDLTTGAVGPQSRAVQQETRAVILMAWLQACSRAALRPSCWVVASGAGRALVPASSTEADEPADRVRDAALWGFTRVAMQEFAPWPLRWVDLLEPRPCSTNAANLTRELLEPDDEDEVLLSRHGRFVPRIGAISAPPAPSRPQPAGSPVPNVRLDFSVPGPFRNLRWHKNTTWLEGEPLQADEVEIEVRAVGLNFRDVMYAMGLLPDEAVEQGFCGPTLGMELAGIVRAAGAGVELAAGDEVIAIAPASFANRVRTQSFAVTRKPADWSFEAAASVPTAFFTAYYALVELAHLQAGERVLIHGAAGGVGIAAIQIAQRLGAEIFATAGTLEKRDFVQLLGADRVFDSRTLTFADEVLQATDGAGVDVVLNSLAGEAMRRNLRLLRPFGRMIELGKRDFYENSRLGLRPFRNNIAYFGVDADQLMAQRPDVARRIFKELMLCFADESLRPLPHRSFSAVDIEVAFRHMQASRHIGKIIVTIPADFAPLEVRPADHTPTSLRADATYLVSGGLSGFGLRTAWWLVRRGARHLALVSRRGAATPEALAAIEELAAAGVRVRAIACDVTDGAALRAALKDMGHDMPPLRGLVHAATVIEDALIRDMDREQLHRVLAPKIEGALQLDQATRASDLDFFVLYSSATTFFGNPGQAAYVAANMALEGLAAERHALGLPVTCVSWGPIGDAGYLARHERVREALVGRLGGRALTADQALEALDGLIATSAPHVGLLHLDWSALGRCLPAGRAPKFSVLARRERRHAQRKEPSQDLRGWLAELPESELGPAITNVVRGEVAQILRVAPERIEAGALLPDLGMDSLMAVELATAMEARFGIQLSALSLSDGPTIERIATRIAQQLRPSEHDAAGGTAGGNGDLTEEVRRLALQHGSEMSAADAARFGIEIQSAAVPLPLTQGRSS
jgi:phthiocerol/phenolphthiocerol synthesis type-I polyketide synthase C